MKFCFYPENLPYFIQQIFIIRVVLCLDHAATQLRVKHTPHTSHLTDLTNRFPWKRTDSITLKE